MLDGGLRSSGDVAVLGGGAVSVAAVIGGPFADVGRVGGLAVAVVGAVDECPGQPGIVAGEPTTRVAEALARAFHEHGEQTPGLMRGAYAAVVSDGSQLWAWRDQVGQIPLFYRWDGAKAWVASEAKQV